MATLVKTRTALTDDDGTGTTGTIWTAAVVTNIEDQIDDFGASIARQVCQGRITLTTAVPVTTADVTAATTIRYAPYIGNHIALYDGSEWDLFTFSELSLALGTDAADTNYDLFAYNSGGTVTLERLAWTNATTRATALTTQDGVLVKSGATTRRYLGTYRTTGTIGQTEDSFAKRFVWNYYHRAPRVLRVTEATDSWNYHVATIRQANGAAGNQVAVVVGWAEVLIDLHVQGLVLNTTGNVGVAVGIGEDSTTAFTSGFIGGYNNAVTASREVQLCAQLKKYPAVGYHYYAWLEYSDATATTTWYGDHGVPTLAQTGLHGWING